MLPNKIHKKIFVVIFEKCCQYKFRNKLFINTTIENNVSAIVRAYYRYMLKNVSIKSNVKHLY